MPPIEPDSPTLAVKYSIYILKSMHDYAGMDAFSEPEPQPVLSDTDTPYLADIGHSLEYFQYTVLFQCGHSVCNRLLPD